MKKKNRYLFMCLPPTHFFAFKTTEETERNVHTCWIFTPNSTLTVLFPVKKKNRDNDNEMKFE